MSDVRTVHILIIIDKLLIDFFPRVIMMSTYTVIHSNKVKGVFDLELLRVIDVKLAGSRGSVFSWYFG